MTKKYYFTTEKILILSLILIMCVFGMESKYSDFPHPYNEYGFNIVTFVTKQGDLEYLREILNESNLYDKDKNNRDVLETATFFDHFHIVKFLILERKFNINDSYALIFSVYSKDTAIMQFLLEQKADPNLITSDRYSALIIASEHGLLDKAQVLLKYKANIHISCTHGITPLMYAARYGSYEMVKLFLEYKPDLNCQDNRGRTALHFSDKKDDEYIKITKLLLKHGANPSIKDNSGLFPINPYRIL